MELAPPLPKPADIFGFKRCFRLCLPALLIGALFRISLLAVLPNACYSPDGGSYFEAAHYLLDKGKLKLNEKRRWIYPISLIGLADLPFPKGATRTIAVAQHLLGLLCVIGVGWVVGNVTTRPSVWVPVGTVLFAVWPSMLYYEHEVMAETLFVATIILAIALAFPIGVLKERRRLFWFLLAAGLVVATKPHGRGLWLGCLLTAAVITGNPFRWRWESWAAIAFGLAMIVTSGSSQQKSWLWLNSSLPLVKTEGAKWSEYRQALAPLVMEVKDDVGQYAWKQALYKKRLRLPDPAAVSPVWAELVRDQKKYGEVASGLAKEAMKSRPFSYFYIVSIKILVGFSRQQISPWLDPAIFWKRQDSWNESRWSDLERVAEMERLYGGNYSEYKRVAVEQAQRKNWIVAPLGWICNTFYWLKSNLNAVTGKYELSPGWLGLLALGGLLCCFRPSSIIDTAILWFPAALYLVTVYGVGDALPRYALPLEWLGIILACISLDRISSAAVSRRPSL